MRLATPRRHARAAGAALRARPARAGAAAAAAHHHRAAGLPGLDQPAALDLGMPWLSGLRRPGQLRQDGRRPALLEFAVAHRRSTPAPPWCCRWSSACRWRCWCCRSRRGRALLRVAAILPIVLAPVVVGLFWRTLVLAPDVRPGRPGHARARPGQPQLAGRPAAGADLGDRDPHLAVDAVRLPGAAGHARRRCRPTSTKRRGSTAPAPGSASATSRCR